MINFIKNILNIIFSQEPDITQKEFKRKRRIIIVSSFSILAVLVFTSYGFVHIFIDYNPFMCFIMFFFTWIFITNIIILNETKNVDIAITVSLLFCILLFSIIMIAGGFSNFAIIWVLLFPLMAFYFKGRFYGLIFNLIFIFVFILIFLLSLFNFIKSAYNSAEFIYIFLAYLFISLITFFYEDTNNKSEKIIIKQFYTDSLTSLPNRTKLLEDLSAFNECCLILVNVDAFKEINDLYGSKIGDLILKELAARLTKLNEEKSVYKIYKLHADEFALLLNKMANVRQLIKMAKKIHNLLSTDFIINDIEVTALVSIGIAEGEKDLLVNADMALKLAKDKKKEYVIFNKSMKIIERYQNNLGFIRKIKKGIASDDIIPYYQPIINNKNNKIEKYECLVRLISNNEIITPYYFLNIAKKTRMYPYITRRMLYKSFKHFNKSKYNFSVNISLDDIIDIDTLNYIYYLLKEFNICKRLIFELTESERIEESEQVKDFIVKVKNMGCMIAIDDFGSGYSNFDYILKMNVDFIKLDSSLIKNIVDNKNSQIIVETIVDFTKKLNIKTIAEFVHSKEVFNKVKELKIDYSQGFYIGEPNPETQE